MKTKLRQKAVEFRLKEQLSYSEIKKRLRVSKSTLSYWLSDLPLSDEKILELRRKGWSKGEASREKYRATMRKLREQKTLTVYKKQLKKVVNLSDQAFFVSGLMLYAAEGGKRKDSTIVLANTDPDLIKFFIKWLQKFLDIQKDKLRVQLHLYENMNINKEKRFWKSKLGIPNSQFYKSSVRQLKRGSFSYRDSFRHGTCSLYTFSTEKRTELMMAIKAFFDTHVRNMRA